MTWEGVGKQEFPAEEGSESASQMSVGKPWVSEAACPKKTMDDNIWFRKTESGAFWKPVVWQGWFVTIFWAVTNVWYFARVDAGASSATEVLYRFGPYFIASTLLFLFIIHKKSGRRWM